MESAMCGRFALSPNHVFNSKPGEMHQESYLICLYLCNTSMLTLSFGDKYSSCRGPCSNLCIPMAVLATGPGRGGGLLEKPVIEKGTPGRESEFDLRKSRKLAPPYRVILHNDDFNRREYVVQVLMKVIPGMTLDNAYDIMLDAHYNGLSVVIICAQADAEEHCMQLRGNGLLSSIEPASGGC
ncbi:ATP-dependent Clp protease adapter protein CLPS1, chloroplastic-like isoform X1 [Neltuma alba]|uniref:ATP-dependent Clp protease adapter protein CLPS1, chloroplastic-like isoform X1 n=1 Tax=Neltuma alba TaxID=207710 RepID=UPI0010A43604|nr:ATP-dependent Clp protease adapter protein CLPS1, chloroplastic-like isoform X1 [Prosopis alba]XP_028795462.1 ATP-dependent Clp protease adapter protein CLPS1, chloroplastic-like isoform X1 [Prosopis alba]